jgi:hypothetical protein
MIGRTGESNMRTRLLILSAAIVALTAGSAYAGSPFGFFPTCGSGKNSQCAFQFVTGNNNVARIDQTSSKRKSFQLGLNLQKGNGNRSYIGQNGGNQVAVTVQSGNNNASYTHQEGTNQLSVTVQSGNGHWAGVSSYGTNALTGVYQTN